MAEPSDRIQSIEDPDPDPEAEEPRLSGNSGPSPENRDGLQATELTQIQTRYSRASSNRLQGTTTARSRPTSFPGRFIYNVKKSWRHQISVTVSHEDCRDHLALERTFLGYLRTSLTLSMIGITVAQLFRLQHSPTPDLKFGFFVLGKPLACICQGSAIYTLVIGAFRTWRQQNAIIRGKAISGGFEVVLLGAGIFVVLILFFVIVIAVDITKDQPSATTAFVV